MALSQWLPVSRRGGGEYDTNDFTVPSGVDNVRVRLDVDPADFTTEATSVIATVQISFDGGQTWKNDMTVRWIGGVLTPPPGKELGWFAACDGINAYVGLRLRVHFSTVGAFRWGLQGELT